MTDDPRVTLREAGYVQRAYELAEEAIAAGNRPFAALLVDGDRVLVESCDTTARESDDTRHAEIVLVAHALRTIAPDVRRRAVLYASAEPCVMCAGAIARARIRRVVFGVDGPAVAEALGEPDEGPRLRDVATVLGLEVRGPVMAQDGLRVYRELWPAALNPR